MKGHRALLVAGFIGACIVALFFMVGRQPAFATPLACLEAYYTAAQKGDMPGVDRCLAESRPGFASDVGLAQPLEQLTANLKNWTVVGAPETNGNLARVTVDERRPDKRLRRIYHLQIAGGSWRITAVGPPQELPEHVPYDTHVSKVPGGP